MAKRVRMVAVPKRNRELTESEITNIFANTAEDNPLWLAIHQLLQAEVDQSQAQATNPELAVNHGALGFAVGGYAWAQEFQAVLVEQFTNARKMPEVIPPVE